MLAMLLFGERTNQGLKCSLLPLLPRQKYSSMPCVVSTSYYVPSLSLRRLVRNPSRYYPP